MNSVPSRPTCVVCGKEVNPASGVFTFETIRGIRFSHRGPCGKKLGAYPGGGAAMWGEISALTSRMLEGAVDGVTLSDAVEACRWRDAGSEQEETPRAVH